MSPPDPVTAAGSPTQKLEREAWQALAGKRYGRALRLFETLRGREPDEPRSLYGLARAQHAAGRINAAEANFRRYLMRNPSDPERQQAAREQLRLIAAQRQQATIRDAEHHGRNGRHALAARLYLRAWRRQPERHQLLLQSARAEYRAGALAAARDRFLTYLRSVPSGDPDRPEVRALLARIAAGRPYGQAPPPPNPIVVREPAPASNLPLGLLVGGALVGGGGLWMYMAAAADEQALYQRFKERNDQGLIVGITHTDARADARAIEGRQNVAAVLGGVSVVTTAVGLVLLLTEQAEGGLTPGAAVGLGRSALRWTF